MRRLYFFDKQFNYKDVIIVNNFNPIVDIISTQNFKIETPLMPVVDNGDICILKDNSAVVFIGNVLNVEESEKKTKTITISYVDELFNINGEVADLSGNIITWITNTLTTNFISVGDNLQKISLSIVNNCSTAYSGTYTFDSDNIKECLRNIFEYSGVYIDFDIDFADNGSIDSLVCNIRSNAEEETIKLKYNMSIISDIKRTVTNSQNVNKLVLLPDETVTGGSRYEFYLLKDGTISTDADDENRFENVKQEIQYYASDYTAESLLNSAKEVLGGEQFNHSIGFYILHNNSFDIALYRKVIFYDKDSTVYNSIITKIQYGTEFDYVELGVVRLKLTDKLQKNDSKTKSVSSSGGGSSYVLPQATGTTLGGVIANEKTTENNEVKIDSATGKLYAQSYDIENKADKVSGAVSGNFAGLDTAGNLIDSGKKASDFETAFGKNTAFNKNFETSTSNIKMNGSVSVGSSSNIARADHTHPSDTSKLNTALKGAVNGLAELDATGKVPSSQLPSFVDDVIEVANFASLPATGESGKIYVTLDTNLTYRWSGSAYTEISKSLALGETSATAYRGDRGKTAYEHSLLTSGNPHSVTKTNVGLSNVDNTSDTNKPVSSAQQTALNLKVNTSAIKNAYDYTTGNLYSAKYIEDNFAPTLFTTTYYANRSGATTANLTTSIPELNASNYLTKTTTNTTFNWTTPNYVFTNTLGGNLYLSPSSVINLTLPFSISVASQTINFGYRIKVNGVAISSNQTLGAVAYTGDSGYSYVNRVILQITTDLLTQKTQYVSGNAVTFEVFTQQASSTSMTMRVYCGATLSGVNYYAYNEFEQVKSQLSNASPTEAGVVYGHTSNINDNTFYGYKVGNSNTTGVRNVFNGFKAGSNNTSGSNNNFIGYQAGYNTTVGNNTFNGALAGYSNTAGGYNVFNGAFAGYSNTTGSFNIFNGVNAGYSNTTGSNNVFSGNFVADSKTTGSNNTIIGAKAGRVLVDIKNSVFLGYETVALNTAGDTNEIVIGYDATGHGSNTATWGNTDITNHYFTGNINGTGDILISTGKTLKVNNVDVITDKAKVDASNLTSGNVDSWGLKLLDKIYPVNSIYMSVASTSPASLFGGTWVQLKDKFLLGAGDTYTNGATGGEATHTLTVAEMPSHRHEINSPAQIGSPYAGGNNVYRIQPSQTSSSVYTMSYTGGDGAHNNMPPYLVVYMWKRTA